MRFVEGVVEVIIRKPRLSTARKEEEENEQDSRPQIVWSVYSPPGPRKDTKDSVRRRRGSYTSEIKGEQHEENAFPLQPEVLEKGIRQCVFTALDYVKDDIILSGGEAVTPPMFTCCVASKAGDKSCRRYAFCKVHFGSSRRGDGSEGPNTMSCILLISTYPLDNAMAPLLQDMVSTYSEDYDRFQNAAQALVNDRTVDKAGVFRGTNSFPTHTCFSPLLASRSSQGASLIPLLQCFDSRGLVLLFTACLTERRVIFCSHHVPTLTSCMMSVFELIYPFVWPHIFVPIMSDSQLEHICAPSPYLIGLLPYQLAQAMDTLGSAAGDLIIVWLDMGYIVSPGRSRPLPDLTESFGAPGTYDGQVQWHLSRESPPQTLLWKEDKMLSLSEEVRKAYSKNGYSGKGRIRVIEEIHRNIKKKHSKVVTSNSHSNPVILLLHCFMFFKASFAPRSGTQKAGDDDDLPWSSENDIEEAFGSNGAAVPTSTGEREPDLKEATGNMYFNMFTYLSTLRHNAPATRSSISSKLSQQFKQTMQAGKRFKYRIQTSSLANRLAKEKASLANTRKSLVNVTAGEVDDQLWGKVVHDSLRSGESPGLRLYRELDRAYEDSEKRGWLESLEQSVRSALLAFNCITFGKTLAFVQFPGEGDANEEAFMCRLDKSTFLSQCSSHIASFLNEALDSQMVLEFAVLEREYETYIEEGGANAIPVLDSFSLWNLLYHRISLKEKRIPTPASVFDIFQLNSARRLPEHSTFGTLMRSVKSHLEQLLQAWYHLSTQLTSRSIIYTLEDETDRQDVCRCLLETSLDWYKDSGIARIAGIGSKGMRTIKHQDDQTDNVQHMLHENYSICFLSSVSDPEIELARSLRTCLGFRRMQPGYWRTICQWAVSFSCFAHYCDGIVAAIMADLVPVVFGTPYTAEMLTDENTMSIIAAVRALNLAHVLLVHGPPRVVELLSNVVPLLPPLYNASNEDLLHAVKATLEMIRSSETARSGVIFHYLMQEGNVREDEDLNIFHKLKREGNEARVLHLGLKRDPQSQKAGSATIYDKAQYVGGVPLPQAAFSFPHENDDDVEHDDYKQELILELQSWATRIAHLIKHPAMLARESELYQYLLIPYSRKTTQSHVAKASSPEPNESNLQEESPVLTRLHERLRNVVPPSTGSHSGMVAQPTQTAKGAHQHNRNDSFDILGVGPGESDFDLFAS
eukprot:gb/GECG01015628.1/.p1 GENE.gb/GECG01015628.1/~~gb/GECG01015628.1/.p1  ORF type:complete len:1198 (+),score=116.42 gb/GECG01015628.1/:1-3594(+)